MGRLLLHIGTHKTGTTSIQRFADRNRDALGERGLYYPSYRAIGVSGHYAHLDVAKTIIGTRTRLGAEGLEKFCTHICSTLSQHQVTLVSAEPFWRGGLESAGNEEKPYWEARHAFIERVASYFPPHSTEILIVCRGQADLVESLFQEEVKVNRWRRGMKHFAAAKKPLFDYRAQAEAWARRFQTVRVLNYEALKTGDALVENFFKSIGVDIAGLQPAARYNKSIQPDFVSALRMLNRSSLDNERYLSAARALLTLQDDPEVQRWAQRSLWRSWEARDAFDQAYHQDNDKMLERFGHLSMPIRSRALDPETTFGERITETALAFLLGKLLSPSSEGASTPDITHPSKGGTRAHEVLGS